jgi:hypothetical protein
MEIWVTAWATSERAGLALTVSEGSGLACSDGRQASWTTAACEEGPLGSCRPAERAPAPAAEAPGAPLEQPATSCALELLAGFARQSFIPPRAARCRHPHRFQRLDVGRGRGRQALPGKPEPRDEQAEADAQPEPDIDSIWHPILISHRDRILHRFPVSLSERVSHRRGKRQTRPDERPNPARAKSCACDTPPHDAGIRHRP